MTDLFVTASDSFDVYGNQALEKHLLDHASEDEVILYLWRNDRTVVIGRNQDACSECDIERLEKENGHLARRISGGGAVYHDRGNLNFSFITGFHNYDLNTQNKVILNALRRFDIEATVSGRNDLEIEGRKFSGHAYHKGRNGVLHHGTLMLQVNEEMLERYLNVSMLKLHSKNIASVRSRIVNLKDIASKLDATILSEALIASAEETYGVKAKPCSFIDGDEVAKLRKRFADDDWKYGKVRNMKFSKERRFSWGTVKLVYNLNEEAISDLAIYTDALDETMFPYLEKQLIGRKIAQLDGNIENEAGDIIRLLKEEKHEI